MNQLRDTEYRAYVGIDWAAAKHDICVQAAAGGAREFARISSQPEGIEALKAISKDPASKIYFMDGSSPTPLPLLHLGEVVRTGN